jgi:AcrR family transcriptional regulator
MGASPTSGRNPGAVAADAPSGAAHVREKLFGIAMSRFRRDGYDGVPVAEITREAKVAKGTFFNHFPQKEHVLTEAFHRLVNEAVGEVAGSRLTGTDAIVAFVSFLGERLAGDRPFADTLLPRLALLPAVAAGEPREEARIRDWIEARLGETLPVTVPVEEVDHGTLAFLLTGALRTTLEEWSRPDAPARPLTSLLHERLLFLLRSAGLPAEARPK